MSSLPADEDYAKSLLTIFSAHRLRPGQSLKAREVSQEFLARNLGRPFDYQAALDYSEEQGWVRRELDWIRLTRVGWSEM